MGVFAELPWEHLDLNSIWIGYQGRNPALRGLLPQRPESPEELLEAAKERCAYTGMETHRAEIADALESYALRHGAPNAVLESVERFRRPGTMAIVTGQQPGLVGGPLFVFHKIATALALARQLRAIDGAPELVVFFWNHSEDHDWGEANHSFLQTPSFDVQKIRLSRSSTGRPLDDIVVSDALRETLPIVSDLLPRTPWFDDEFAACQPTHDAATLGEQLTRQLFRHFGDQGLLVLEPRAFPDGTRELLGDFHQRSESLRSQLKTTASELSSRGFDVTLDPEIAFLFHIPKGGKRSAIPDGEHCPEGDRPSPGALYRNLWQDAVLPTFAFVAGPGELSYIALTGGLYQELGIPMPPLVPRVSFTHVDPRHVESLSKWKIGINDLRLGHRQLERKIAQIESDENPAEMDTDQVEEAIRELAEQYASGLRALEGDVARIDRNLVLPLVRVGNQTLSSAKKLASKVRNQRLNRGGIYRQHARRLTAELLPNGRMQERVLPALPFLVRYGPRFTEGLLAEADPFATAHRMITTPRAEGLDAAED